MEANVTTSYFPTRATGAAIIAGLAALTSVPAAGPASAAIRCDGNFQINQYGRINTPYCEDDYLARVAREYGVRVSADAIRGNPSVKERTCRLVGNDNRVRSTCQQYMPHNDNRRWR